MPRPKLIININEGFLLHLEMIVGIHTGLIKPKFLEIGIFVIIVAQDQVFCIHTAFNTLTIPI